MSVEVVVVIAGVLFFGTFLCLAWWALTRTRDRIPVATLCLLLCIIVYGSIAAGAALRDGMPQGVALAFGVYAVFLYAVMATQAVHHSRWAWRASIGAFGIQILLTALGTPTLLHAGKAGMAAIALGFAVGGLGLWACLHRGSRELVARGTADNSLINATH